MKNLRNTGKTAQSCEVSPEKSTRYIWYTEFEEFTEWPCVKSLCDSPNLGYTHTSTTTTIISLYFTGFLLQSYGKLGHIWKITFRKQA